MDLERDIADFLGIEASILYSQGFSTIPCVISAFAKRGDIIVADRGINFAIQKGLQISCSIVRWFDLPALKSLEDVLLSAERNVANGANLLRDDSLSPRESSRRTAPWLIYPNS